MQESLPVDHYLVCLETLQGGCKAELVVGHTGRACGQNTCEQGCSSEFFMDLLLFQAGNGTGNGCCSWGWIPDTGFYFFFQCSCCAVTRSAAQCRLAEVPVRLCNETQNLSPLAKASVNCKQGLNWEQELRALLLVVQDTWAILLQWN